MRLHICEMIELRGTPTSQNRWITVVPSSNGDDDGNSENDDGVAYQLMLHSGQPTCVLFFLCPSGDGQKWRIVHFFGYCVVCSCYSSRLVRETIMVHYL